MEGTGIDKVNWSIEVDVEVDHGTLLVLFYIFCCQYHTTDFFTYTDDQHLKNYKLLLHVGQLKLSVWHK